MKKNIAVLILSLGIPAAGAQNLAEKFLAEDDQRYEAALKMATETNRRQSEELNNAIAITSEQARKFCSKKNVNIRQLIEVVARQRRVNPTSVKLAELGVASDPLFGATCIARLYHDKGLCQTIIRFDERGSGFPVGNCE